MSYYYAKTQDGYDRMACIYGLANAANELDNCSINPYDYEYAQYELDVLGMYDRLTELYVGTPYEACLDSIEGTLWLLRHHYAQSIAYQSREVA